MESGASPEIEGFVISNLSTFSWTSTLHVSSELTHTYGRDAHRDQASIQGDQSLCFSEAYLLQACLRCLRMRGPTTLQILSASTTLGDFTDSEISARCVE